MLDKVSFKYYCSSKECKKESNYHLLRHWTVNKFLYKASDHLCTHFVKTSLKILGLTLSVFLAVPTLGLSLYVAYDFLQEQKRQEFFLNKKVQHKKSKRSSKSSSYKRSKEKLPKSHINTSDPKKVPSPQEALPQQSKTSAPLLDLQYLQNYLLAHNNSLPDPVESLPTSSLLENFVNEERSSTFIPRLPIEQTDPEQKASAVAPLKEAVQLDQEQTTFTFSSGEALQALQVNPMDPIIYADLSEEEEVIIFRKDDVELAFFSSTLINHVLVRDTNTLKVKINNKWQDIILWENGREYIQFLSFLTRSSLIEEEQKSRIEKKITALQETKEFINRFEQENEVSFFTFINNIKTLMSMSSAVGASCTSSYQSVGRELFFELYRNLEESIKKTLFVYYTYNIGDPQCINSSSKVLAGQIQRLITLNLVNKTEEITAAEIKQLSPEEYQSFIDDLHSKVEWIKKQNTQVEEDSAVTLYEWEGYPAQTATLYLYNQPVIFKFIQLSTGGNCFLETLAAAVYFFNTRFKTPRAHPLYTAIDVSEKDNLEDFSFIAEKIQLYLNKHAEEIESLLPRIWHPYSFDTSSFTLEEQSQHQKTKDLLDGVDTSGDYDYRLDCLRKNPDLLKKYTQDPYVILTYLSSLFEGFIPDLSFSECCPDREIMRFIHASPLARPAIFRRDNRYFLITDRSDIHGGLPPASFPF